MTYCIILDGVCCAGATSIAHEIQKAMPQTLHIELKKIAQLYTGMFPENYVHSNEWDENRFARRNSIATIISQMAIIGLKQGFNVCIDVGMDGPDHDKLLKIYMDHLSQYNPVLVAVKCDEEALVNREPEKGTKELLAKYKKSVLEIVHAQIKDGIYNKPYALTVDTTHSSAKDCAKIICDSM